MHKRGVSKIVRQSVWESNMSWLLNLNELHPGTLLKGLHEFLMVLWWILGCCRNHRGAFITHKEETRKFDEDLSVPPVSTSYLLVNMKQPNDAMAWIQCLMYVNTTWQTCRWPSKSYHIFSVLLISKLVERWTLSSR